MTEDRPRPAAERDSEGRELIDGVRHLKWDFARLVEAHRSALFGYCRKLARDPFDAEDLHQETLLRAFARLSERFEPIANLRGYLFRIATNLWIDRGRRERAYPDVAELPREFAAPGHPTAPFDIEISEAAVVILRTLPPREATSFLLRDVLDYSVADAAALLGATEAAVKMATSRARRRLAEIGEGGSAAGVSAAAREIAERFAVLFRSRDIPALLALIGEHARARVMGCASEDGRDEILRGSLHYALTSPQIVDVTVHEYANQPILAMWYDGASGEGPVVRDFMRLTAEGGQIIQIESYFFSPDLLSEVGEALGVHTATNGHATFERGWWNDATP